MRCIQQTAISAVRICDPALSDTIYSPRHTHTLRMSQLEILSGFFRHFVCLVVFGAGREGP